MIDHQIAYVCGTDQTVEFLLYSLQFSDDLKLATVFILMDFDFAIFRKISTLAKLKCRQNVMKIKL